MGKLSVKLENKKKVEKRRRVSVKFITAPKFYDRIELNSQFEFIPFFGGFARGPFWGSAECGLGLFSSGWTQLTLPLVVGGWIVCDKDTLGEGLVEPSCTATNRNSDSNYARLGGIWWMWQDSSNDEVAGRGNEWIGQRPYVGSICSRGIAEKNLQGIWELKLFAKWSAVSSMVQLSFTDSHFYKLPFS